MTTPQRFFQRYQSPNPLALAEQVEQQCEELAQARLDQNEQIQLELLSQIGASSTVLGREVEAAPIIEEALALARKHRNKELEVGNLLNLATARQYLGDRELAQTLFEEALEKGRAYGISEYEDFVLHHRGRCFVEQGKIEEARRSFEQALILREEKGDPRFIASTRRALNALDKPLQEILGTSVKFSLE
jgi:tetratricopeptide (TPR) repeat protein